jgi:Domain of unknown function (DUF4157)
MSGGFLTEAMRMRTSDNTAANRPSGHRLAKTNSSVAPGVRRISWHALQRCVGNAQLTKMLQPKLCVSRPDDVYEREADRVADDVMRMQEPAQSEAASGARPLGMRIQRLCPECEQGLQRKTPMEDEEPLIQGKRDGAVPDEGASAIEPYVNALSGRGEPLPAATRAFFEPRFGADFSAVRVHADAAADRSAESINAVAYTSGSHVVFRAGRYDPVRPEGKHLLAHELVHVLQQGASAGRIQRQACPVRATGEVANSRTTGGILASPLPRDSSISAISPSAAPPSRPVRPTVPIGSRRCR